MKYKLYFSIFQITILSRSNLTVNVKYIINHKHNEYISYRDCNYSSIIEALFSIYPGAF